MKQKKIWKGKPTLYSVLVLLILLGTALNLWHRGENPLLNRQNAITLYRKTYVGQIPEFHTEDFFPDEELDYEKVTYDVSACDFDTPGVYMVPVLYDGEETNCVVQVTVEDDETDGNLETPEGAGTTLEKAD